MSKVKVAINGFGRIGRITFRALQKKQNIEVVAINDLTDPKTLAYLLKYDSVHGVFDGSVDSDGDSITVNGNRIAISSEKDPGNLPWKQLSVDIVIESTGFFLDVESAGKHIQAGARKVILSAPANSQEIKTVVLGVNDNLLTDEDVIISNASCTTNCAAPMVKVLDELCAIEKGYITTIHSYTGDQRLQDAPHKDLRRARASAVSMIPTSTGAAKAITKIFPHLDGAMDGSAIRVPVPDGSLTDLICIVKNPATKDEINQAFHKAANSALKGVLEYTDEPIVSIDIIGNPNSCIFDSQLTSVNGNMIKILGWYDNEAGYSNRMADLVEKIS